MNEPIPPNVEPLPEPKAKSKEGQSLSPELISALTAVFRKRNCRCHLEYNTDYTPQWKMKD